MNSNGAATAEKKVPAASVAVVVCVAQCLAVPTRHITSTAAAEVVTRQVSPRQPVQPDSYSTLGALAVQLAS